MMDYCLNVQLMTALILRFFAYDGLLNLNHMDKLDLSLDAGLRITSTPSIWINVELFITLLMEELSGFL